MSLKHVVLKALKRLSGNGGVHGNVSSPSDGVENFEYFCAEDSLLTSDLNVTVTGVGKLSFPLTTDAVENIVKVSSKAKFGKGEATQMIPANILKVGINEESLCNILERISSGLNISKNSRLVPHLYNMLICGPGQFFKMHRDTEKIKNMVATLVCLLPSSHKGGDLIIRHKDSKHIFFCSQKCNIVKCIVFDSGCQQEIEKVTEGFRVALTYNVLLQSPGVNNNMPLDDDLNRAVKLYFSSESTPRRLVVQLDHNYSEHSLTWNSLKGSDHTHVSALLAVAKKQGRVPCLTLADYKEECEMSYWNVDEVIESGAIFDKELCYIKKTTDSFEPYRVYEEPLTSNEGGTIGNWFRPACVVLWSSKWDFKHGFNNALQDLKQLTAKEGNEKLVIDEIDKAGSKFFNRGFWNDTIVVNSLMDIAAYVKNKEKAIAILTKLSNEVLSPDRIDYIIFLELNYDKDVLVSIVQSWNETDTEGLYVQKSVAIIEKYLASANKKHNSLFIKVMLERTVNELLRTNEKYCDLNIFKGSQLETMYKIFKICADLEQGLEKRMINYMFLHSSIYPLNLTNVLLQVLKMIPQTEIHKHRNFALSTLAVFNKLKFLLTKEETDWSWPFNLPCSCVDCYKLLAFLHSSDKTMEMLLSETNRRHINSALKYLKGQPVKYEFKSALRVAIDKEPELVETRKKLLKDLVYVENKLRKWASIHQKTFHSEDTIDNKKVLSFSGSSNKRHGCKESANKRKKKN